MNHIKSLHIEGFKKFELLDFSFNEHMNIVVGENEAGKSTIFEALKIALNQQYRNADKSILRDLFNAKAVANFELNPCIKNLPKIIIEVELILDPFAKNSSYFHGEVYGNLKRQDEKFGIRFECKFDELLGSELESSIKDKKIPYEYYSFTWKTFANNPYLMMRKPIQFLAVDTTNNSTTSSFNYYNRTLFSSRYDEPTRAKAKNDFRTKIIDAFDDVALPSLGSNRKFGIDAKKVALETIISVYEDNIALENRGSGMESLVKTEIALEKANGLDAILIEEPENHLSFTTLQKMLNDISKTQENSQIIVTTHNSMIASRLNLNNVLWVTDRGVKSLSSVSKDVADFFVKADDNAFLQLLLSKKVILVEGATEYLLLPEFYNQLAGKTIETDEVTIISCNGISFTKYLEIAKETDKKIAVITDNDKNQRKIDYAKNFNINENMQHIFMAESVEEWTWEICMYNYNKSILDKIIKVKADKKYLYHGEDFGAVLGKMLNNKVDTAYKILKSNENFEIPQYVKDAIEWLKS